MLPTIGRIVHYQLTAADAQIINKRREDFNAFRREGRDSQPGQAGASGHVAHVGNHASEGDYCPAMVVRTFGEGAVVANLQVFLDGNDTYWATSRKPGDEPGTWTRPPRVPA